MIIDRRAFLAASAAAAAFPSRAIAASGPILTPEQFGARGDGTTNDTAAFARLSAQVTRRGGGTISLRAGRTYLVGGQTRGGGKFGWNPSPIIELERLPGPIQIIGNGARLRAQPGLKLGTFDLGSGGPVHHPMPNLNHDDLAIPYRAMIWIGALVHAFPDPDPARATHFTGCLFTDDPKLSPTGQVYTGRANGGPIVNLAASENVTFDSCTFSVVGLAKLPSKGQAIFRNCTMRQGGRLG